jgi:hypothetical protein
MTIAKLPLAKDIEDFDFTGMQINGCWSETSLAVTSLRISAMWF